MGFSVTFHENLEWSVLLPQVVASLRMPLNCCLDRPGSLWKHLRQFGARLVRIRDESQYCTKQINHDRAGAEHYPAVQTREPAMKLMH